MTGETGDDGRAADLAPGAGGMTTDWLERIQDLLLRALDVPEDERADFLGRVCADDAALKREVESLLHAHSTPGPMDRMADTLGARVLAEFVEGGLEGETVGRYEIRQRLGRGGMSVVYRAWDPELEREVALKFLPVLLSEDRGSRERFLVEAQVAAGLEHPNICTIHEIGETDDGRLFLAMPLYKGETVREKLDSGPLSEAETLRLALQAARGLAKAHERGVIHRDVKPDNLMITREGTLKILDFGIAQLEGAADPTGQARGTLLYMSPEQVVGRPIDTRADLWSLGVVLYEMLAGRRPIEEETLEGVRRAFREWEITSLEQVRPGVSAPVAALVGTLLRKDPSLRPGSAAELEKELRRLRGGRDEEADEKRVAHRRLAAAAGVLGAVLLSLVGVWSWRDSPSTGREGISTAPRWTRVTFSGDVVAAAISPDGREVAYVTGPPSDNPGVSVQDLGGGEPVELAAFAGYDRVWVPTFAWSPDGSSLLHGDRIIPRPGGAPRRIRIGEPAAWSPDGRTIGSFGGDGRLYLTDAATPEMRELPLPRASAHGPGIDWSPAGGLIAYVTTDAEGGWSSLWSATLDGRRRELLLKDTLPIASPRWSPDGRTVYYLSGTDALRALRISEEGTVAGDSELLLSGLQLGPGVVKTFSLTRDGRRLAYARNVGHSNLWRVSLDRGGMAGTTYKKRLTTGTSTKWGPAVSPDGRFIAYVEGIIGGPPNDILIIPSDGGDPTRLTVTGGVVTYPSWSPDSRRIAFGADVGGVRQVWTARIGQPPEPLEDTRLSEEWGGTVTWAPGERIAYDRAGTGNVFLVDPETGIEEPLLAELADGWIGRPRFSPDGRRLAVRGNLGQGERVWTISLADRVPTRIGERRYPVRWSDDGLGVYAFIVADTVLNLLPASGGDPIAVTGLPRECWPHLEIVPGEEELICVDVQQSNDVWVVEDFDPRARTR